MLLKPAFNIMTKLHSRSVTIKRIGSPDIVSAGRATPSNYFRFLEGPSATTIRGREFILPIDTLTGHKSQIVTFSAIPTVGAFILSYLGNSTAEIPFDVTSANLQTALRLVDGLEAVTVSGDATTGFKIVMVGITVDTLIVSSQGGTPVDATISVNTSAMVPWSPILRRGDIIIDPVVGHMAMDEIIEIVDLGGDIMGFRVRCE